MNRIARILAPKPAPARVSPLAPTFAALAVVAAALGGVLQAHAQAEVKKPAPKPAPIAVKKAAKPVGKSVKKAKRDSLVLIKEAHGRIYAIDASPQVVKGRVDPSDAGTHGTGGYWTYPAATAPVAQKTAVAPLTTAKAPIAKAAPLVGTATKAPKAAVATVRAAQTTARAPVVDAAQGGVARAVGPAGFGGGGFGGQNGGLGGFGGGGFGGPAIDETTVEVTGDRVSIDTSADGFAAVMRKLAKKAKLSVVIEPGQYQLLQLTLNDQPVENAIRILCRAAGATYRFEDDVYYVSSRIVNAAPSGGLGGGGLGRGD